MTKSAEVLLDDRKDSQKIKDFQNYCKSQYKKNTRLKVKLKTCCRAIVSLDSFRFYMTLKIFREKTFRNKNKTLYFLKTIHSFSWPVGFVYHSVFSLSKDKRRDKDTHQRAVQLCINKIKYSFLKVSNKSMSNEHICDVFMYRK